MEKSKYQAIVNPAAGNGLGEMDWNKIQTFLDEKGIDYETYFTKNYSATMDYIRRQLSSGYRNFLVVGGDGTLNEVANGLMSQNQVVREELTLSVIPIGTGNDWCRTFEIPFDYPKAVEIVAQQKYYKQDIGKVTYLLHGKKESRYFINVAGMGFDAFVANKTNQKSGRGSGSSMSYLWNLFSSLFQYRSTKIKMEYDEGTYERMVFSACIGIGKYNGGGMKQLPNAIQDDGLFDLTIINKVSKLEIIRNIKKLYDGSLLNHPKIDGLKSRKIKLTSEPAIKIELDGEVCGESPFEFELLPKALRVCSLIANQQ